MTNVPKLAQVAVVAPLGGSDHLSLSAEFQWHRFFLTCVLAGGCF